MGPETTVMRTRFVRRIVAFVLLLVVPVLVTIGCSTTSAEPQSFTGQEPVQEQKPYYQPHSKGSQWGRVVYP